MLKIHEIHMKIKVWSYTLLHLIISNCFTNCGFLITKVFLNIYILFKIVTAHLKWKMIIFMIIILLKQVYQRWIIEISLFINRLLHQFNVRVTCFPQPEISILHNGFLTESDFSYIFYKSIYFPRLCNVKWFPKRANVF